MSKPFKLLALCDAPSTDTGFGVVAQNLFGQWGTFFKKIDVYGINYWGDPHELPYRIWPASWPGRHWASKPSLQAFLEMLREGDYTHVFLMQDTFNLSNGWFPAELQRICREKGIVSTLYYPVDAALDPAWVEIIAAVQVPVAYTLYGKRETLRAMQAGGADEAMLARMERKIQVLPHGVDRFVFNPLEHRAQERAKRIKGLPEGTVVMVNVNANQRRKDPMRCLEILRVLRDAGMPVFLLMHMPPTFSDGDGNLEVIGAQLGLRYGKDWMHTAGLFHGNIKVMPKAELNAIYNMADLLISTTLGEGWGLSTTESLAAGCQVAIPDHTSCGEIARTLAANFPGESNEIMLLPVERDAVMMPLDNSRCRYRTHVEGAAKIIFEAWQQGRFAPEKRQRLTGRAAKWLSWKRIAEEWESLLNVAPERPQPKPSPAAETGVSKHYWFQIWGGLGDAFNALAHQGAWNRLLELQPDEQVTVGLMTHNPFVRELFTLHPKFAQMRLLEYGYWQTGEFRQKMKQHGLPLPGTVPLPAGSESKMDFAAIKDGAVDLLCDYLEQRFPEDSFMVSMSRVVLIAPTAGLKERDIPREWLEMICRQLRAAGLILVQVGRNFTRFDRQEMDLGELVDLSLVDKLTVPGTAKVLRCVAGIVTCHSALNLLAWHLRKPQLLIYPDEVQKHLNEKTTWGFGADYPETVCAPAGDAAVMANYGQRFLEILQGVVPGGLAATVEDNAAAI